MLPPGCHGWILHLSSLLTLVGSEKRHHDSVLTCSKITYIGREADKTETKCASSLQNLIILAYLPQNVRLIYTTCTAYKLHKPDMS